jgi:hypothetical protein
MDPKERGNILPCQADGGISTTGKEDSNLSLENVVKTQFLVSQLQLIDKGTNRLAYRRR